MFDSQSLNELGINLLNNFDLDGNIVLGTDRLIINVTNHHDCLDCRQQGILHPSLKIFVIGACRGLARAIDPVMVELHIFGEAKGRVFKKDGLA